MSFSEKRIKAIFRLENQTFKNGSNQLELKGMRMVASIQNFGVMEQGTTQLRIWGMRPEDMNVLLTFAIRTSHSKNGLALLASDDNGAMTQVFSGTIFSAYTDYHGLPNVALCVEAQPGWFEKMAPIAANSFQGETDVAEIMAALAKSAGFSFVNHGVNIQLINHYLWGSVMDQIADVVRSTGIGCRLTNETLEIWPTGDSTDEESLQLSADTGLVGYPEFDPYGLAVTSLFNANLNFGRKVSITSEIPQACGDFIISQCVHNISEKVPGGPWFSSLRVWNNDVPRTYN